MKKLTTTFLLALLLTTSASGQFFAPQQKPMLGLQVNRVHPQSKGLKFLMLGNEGSGNKVFDSSGNSFHGTFGNSPAWVSGKSGSAVEFFGTSQYIDMGVCPEPLKFLSTDFTLIARVMPHGAGFNVICGNDYAVSDGGWTLSTDIGSSFIFRVGDESDSSPVGAWTANQWVDVAIVFRSDSDTLSWYINGRHTGDDTVSNNMGYTAGYHFVIGVDPRDLAGQDWDGLIEYLFLYNRILTASEIAQLYREPFCMFEPSWNYMLYGAIGVPTGAGQVIIIN